MSDTKTIILQTNNQAMLELNLEMLRSAVEYSKMNLKIFAVFDKIPKDKIGGINYLSSEAFNKDAGNLEYQPQYKIINENETVFYYDCGCECSGSLFVGDLQWVFDFGKDIHTYNDFASTKCKYKDLVKYWNGDKECQRDFFTSTIDHNNFNDAFCILNNDFVKVKEKDYYIANEILSKFYYECLIGKHDFEKHKELLIKTWQNKRGQDEWGCSLQFYNLVAKKMMMIWLLMNGVVMILF